MPDPITPQQQRASKTVLPRFARHVTVSRHYPASECPPVNIVQKINNVTPQNTQRRNPINQHHPVIPVPFAIIPASLAVILAQAATRRLAPSGKPWFKATARGFSLITVHFNSQNITFS
jgi:hypothetical protein